MELIEAVWSKGIARWCDHHGPAWYPDAGTETVQSPQFFAEHFSNVSQLVWVRLSTRARLDQACDLKHFTEAALPLIDRPFVLVTTDGDASVPRDLPSDVVAPLISSPHLIVWHTQNYSGYPHSKFAPFPIGLDLHTPRPEGGPETLYQLIKLLRLKREDIRDQPLRLISDIGLSLASKDRIDAARALHGQPHVTIVEQRISQLDIWKAYASHSFVLSAAGFGLDCHRTYEALYLGSIVITKHSSLDELFRGLPVVFVDDWSEACSVERLREWRSLYAPLTDWENVSGRLHPKALLANARSRLSVR